MRFRSPVRRGRAGDFVVDLSEDERDVLRSLPGQLREVLAAGDDDPSVRRLFPPAYAEDPEREQEYRQLMGDDLLERHMQALDVLEETAGATRLDNEQLSAWMRALNELRLVLGTRLDVTEDADERPVDPEDPRAPGFALYDYLTWLQGEVIDALSSG